MRRPGIPERPSVSAPVPVPYGGPRTIEEMLSVRFGGDDAADDAMARVSFEAGISEPRRIIAALALVRSGVPPEQVGRSLTWDEFEEFCRSALFTAGYSPRRNVRLRKPTRQIDLLAESPSLLLSVDCKHWKRGLGWASLAKIVRAQVERTRQYKTRLDVDERPILPMIITLAENYERLVDQVPVVPLSQLKAFLTSVNRFDERFLFV